jgi:hypothetical protein
VRLFGVTASNLVEATDEQLTLDAVLDVGTPEGRARDDASRAVDAIRARFGEGAVGPAALVDADGLRLKRQGDTQWGPRGRGDR